VLVIGGGHAGTEAVAAAARLGARALLVSQRLDTIGEMSCNPSIGGIGKGHLVREVDALDGLMGKLIDEAGIHFRMLNERKGPAVRGPRAQADRDIYRVATQEALRHYPGVELVEGSVAELIIDDAEAAVLGARPATVRGVRLEDGTEIFADSVVITTGTFLRGVVHVGQESRPAGRYIKSEDREVEPPASKLAASLGALRLPLARLKTGTPPRLDGRTIDWEHLEPQPSSRPPQPFSYVRAGLGLPVAQADRLIDCYRTATNVRTHQIVLANAHLLPKYEGPGPRYCPSLTAKVTRFAGRDSHGIWLEPEGLNSHLVYPNGLSSAFPEEVQKLVIQSIAGLEKADIIRPAYDVEYDFVDPRAVDHSLAVKACKGLYLAGQVLGTTGYEEAAALGLVAGANAALAPAGFEPFVVGREEGYIGVLVDDLVSAGTSEPYRMFTSRAEYRLCLRQDNADLRLTARGAAAGLVVDEQRIELAQRKVFCLKKKKGALESLRLGSAEWHERGFSNVIKQQVIIYFGPARSGAEMMAMPETLLEQVEAVLVAKGILPGKCFNHTNHHHHHHHHHHHRINNMIGGIDPLAREEVTISAKYANYLKRQEDEVARWRAHEGALIPASIDYHALASLSSEEVEKLDAARPSTLGEAAAIQGITPNSLTYLLAHIRSR
ncbi:tRNA uridine 5-carboxymethylaminomethyl modification enzyme MnmG, partial [Pavlovales sp. CCMP2436]